MREFAGTSGNFWESAAEPHCPSALSMNLWESSHSPMTTTLCVDSCFCLMITVVSLTLQPFMNPSPQNTAKFWNRSQNSRHTGFVLTPSWKFNSRMLAFPCFSDSERCLDPLLPHDFLFHPIYLRVKCACGPLVLILTLKACL